MIGLRMFLIVSVILTGECAVAQRLKNFSQKYELGIEATFGFKSFTLSSDMNAINNLKVMTEGGTLGLTLGSGILKGKVRQGYYYSASNVGKTIDYVRSAGIINFYPLQLINKDNNEGGLQPFITAGVERNIMKMYGFYGPDYSSANQINYSISEAPYLGRIVNLQASVGAGLEYSIKKAGHFVSIFTEVKYGKNVANLYTSKVFDGTRSGNQTTLNVGINFGYHK
jgi:hypothetical protein